MHHGRIRTTLIALAGASALLLLPATALAGTDDPDKAPLRAEKRHFLKMYKVEKQVSLFGEDYYHDDRTHVYCKPGDFAIDGMWRVDNVDQDANGVKNLTDVDVYASYADHSDHSKWHFEFYNNNQGQAQIKLFATCLGEKTAENSHQHEWSVIDALKKSESKTYTALGYTGSGSGPRCNLSGEKGTVIAPGFEWERGFGRITQSRPSTEDLVAWFWNFDVSLLDSGTNDAVFTYHFKCLDRKSSVHTNGSGKQHFHKLKRKWRTVTSPTLQTGFTRTIEKDTVQTDQIGCWQHSKAMLHSFNVNVDGSLENWFLGMDPRPKKRAYKTWNKDPLFDHDAQYGVVCWHDRTGKKRRP